MAANKAPKVLVLNADVRNYFRPRKASDLRTTTVHDQERRETITTWIDGQGGLASALAEIIKEDPNAPREKPQAGEVERLLWAMSDDERKQCLEVAEELWRKIPPTNANDADHHAKQHLLTMFASRSDWAAVVAQEALTLSHYYWEVDLLFGTLTDPDLIVAIAKKFRIADSIANVLLTLGESSGAVLAPLLAHARHRYEENAVLRAIQCVGTPEAAKAIALKLRKKEVKQAAFHYFATFPHLAREALAEYTSEKKKTQIADVARMILANVERAVGAVGAVVGGHDNTAAPPVENATTERDVANIASAEEIPAFLLSPTWKTAAESTTPITTTRKKIVVLKLPIPTTPIKLHWSERSRRRFIAANFDWTVITKTDAEVATLQKAIDAGEQVTLDAGYSLASINEAIDKLGEDKVLFGYGGARNILAVYAEESLRTLGSLVSIWKYIDPQYVEAPIITAENITSQLHISSVARSPETALYGLIPLAVGEDGKSRATAENSLHYLVRKGHRDLIMKVAASFGPLAVSSVEEILAWDSSQELTKTPPLPGWYRVKEQKPVLLRNGKALPHAALETLDRILVGTKLYEESPLLNTIRDVCEPRSLSEHAWDLARASDINDTNRDVLQVIAHVADDEVVRRLTPTLKGTYIPVTLGAIGTDAALMELFTILARVTRQGLTRRPPYSIGTEFAISAIAMQRGMEPDELEDRFVPTFNVDAQSGVPLDLGKKTFRVAFDQRLVPILSDENGEVVKALPRGKDVEPAKLKAARVLVAELAEDVSAIASLRSVTLETAMCTGRLWTPADFVAYWVKHPLMIHLVRGVIWESRDPTNSGAVRPTFRVTEDGSFADVSDEPMTVPEGHHIGVVHPARLTKEERDGWTNLFSDYKLLQPFDQLGREMAVFSEDERKLGAIKRTLVLKKKYDQKTYDERIRRSGWQSGRRHTWALPFEGNVYGLIRVERYPGTVTASVAKDRRMVTFADVNDVVCCEVMRVLSLTFEEPK